MDTVDVGRLTTGSGIGAHVKLRARALRSRTPNGSTRYRDSRHDSGRSELNPVYLLEPELAPDQVVERGPTVDPRYLQMEELDTSGSFNAQILARYAVYLSKLMKAKRTGNGAGVSSVCCCFVIYV